MAQQNENQELMIPFPKEELRDGREILTWQKGWIEGYYAGRELTKSEKTYQIDEFFLRWARHEGYEFDKNVNKWLKGSFYYSTEHLFKTYGNNTKTK